MSEQEGTDKARAEALAICNAATPGPWRVEDLDCGDYFGKIISHADGYVSKELGGMSRPDRDFIVSARTGWPEALRRVAELEARLAAFEASRAENAYLDEEQCEVKQDLDPDPECECAGCETRRERRGA